MTIPVFPAFYAEDVEWRPEGGSITGGVGVGGARQVGFFAGGPLWRLTMSGIVLASTEELKAARAVQAALDDGAAVWEIGPDQCWFRPVADITSGTVPHSDGTPFSDGSEYAASPVIATVAVGAAERASEITIQISQGGPIIGGEDFSLDHPAMGRRMYRVTSIVSDNGTGLYTLKIRPLLREAVSSLVEADFNNPSCLMRYVSGFDLPIRHGLMCDTDVVFEEWFGESLDPAPPDVTELAAEDTGSGQATISFRLPWSERFEGGTYEVYRGASGAAFGSTTKINGPTAGTRGQAISLNHTGLAAATYRWYVKTISADGDFNAPAEYVEAAIT